MGKIISVIIVSYNSEDFIKKCVGSVLKNLDQDGELIILDNNSTDKTVAILEKFLPKIKLIKSDQNLGFSKGNNKAAKEAAGDFLFFLNPDTEIKRPIFTELIDFYKSSVDAGVIGPKLVLPNGQVQESVKHLPTIWGAIKEFIFGVKYAYSQYVPKSNKLQEVEAVYGAAMLIKKDLFEKLKGFDEKFFLYYEDVDLCKRVREAGKKIYYYPGVETTHLVGATKSEKNRYELNYESFVKYHGVLEAFILQLIFIIPRLRRRLNLG